MAAPERKHRCRHRNRFGVFYIPFVHDTPNVWEITKAADCWSTSRESHPNCRSDRAAQCSDAFKTGVALSFRLSWPCRGQPYTHSRFSRSPHSGSWRTRLSWLVLSHIAGTEVLANGYSVFKVQVRIFVPHSLTATWRPKKRHVFRNFLKKFLKQCESPKKQKKEVTGYETDGLL